MRPSFYLAASFHRRSECALFAHHMRQAGLVDLSRWIDHENCQNDEDRATWAEYDRVDAINADVLVLLNPYADFYFGTGGRWVEVGTRLATLRPVLLVGEKSNIFCHHRVVRQIGPGWWRGEFNSGLADRIVAEVRSLCHSDARSAQSVAEKPSGEPQPSSSSHTQ